MTFGQFFSKKVLTFGQFWNIFIITKMTFGHILKRDKKEGLLNEKKNLLEESGSAWIVSSSLLFNVGMCI